MSYYALLLSTQERHRNKITIFRGFIKQDIVSWVLTKSKPPCLLSTLALPLEIKNSMLNDIEAFLSPKERAFYERCGMLYRRGYLLYGPPGTRKSSICFGAFSLISIHLLRRCIVLLKDVDNARISQDSYRRIKDPGNTSRVENSRQENKLDGAGISLSALLNYIDSVIAQEGYILIMTTNHLEKLDPALIREGWADKRYHFDFVDTISAKQLFYAFFDKASLSIPSISVERKLNDRSI
ncbi:ATPase AAA-type core [Penicillium coprophilum]|uniref:ATPase AAA-type core n=1 Tax=Penicillium coprophilum TaxID=36646 RepID=UPI00238C5843|nr:ATPase AAA-type core [Penicillium coprophilum]KAJ5153972.1 ATPase AAA-type core [Penicillium coprophilum]